jgi:hypothetical protein
LPPQPIRLATLPMNPKTSSPCVPSRLSFLRGRHLLRPGHGFCRIPFRITFFADHHHLTPIESYSYKNRGRGRVAHAVSLESAPTTHAAVTSLESAVTKKTGEGVLLFARNPTKDFCPEPPSGVRDLSDRPRKDLFSNPTIEDSDLVGKDFCPECVSCIPNASTGRRWGVRALSERTPNFRSARHRGFLDDHGPRHKGAGPGFDCAGDSARHPALRWSQLEAAAE